MVAVPIIRPIEGEPLYYFAVAGRKNYDVPREFYDKYFDQLNLKKEMLSFVMQGCGEWVTTP